MIYFDRSRWERGIRHCPRARYLEYDLAETGIRSSGRDLALTTGQFIHQVVEEILKAATDGCSELTRGATRNVIQGVLNNYRADGMKLFDDEPDLPEQVSYLIKEQGALIEAFGWAFYRVILPYLLQEFYVLSVEVEDGMVLQCSCGYGDVPHVPVEEYVKEHERRGCGGVALMTRSDMVLRHKVSNIVSVWDTKSSGYGFYKADFDHQVQFALGTLGAERRLGEEVPQFYILGLYKGKREADRSDFSDEKLKKQRSQLIYAYYKPADPPYTAAKYEWEYTRAKGFNRTPIWEIPEAGGVEKWVMELLPEEVVREQVTILGPFQRDAQLMESLKVQLYHYEMDWDARRSRVSDWSDLDKLFPQSWDCVPYKDHPCSFLGVCHRHPGWEDPFTMLGERGQPRYEARVPHHLLELKKHEEG